MSAYYNENDEYCVQWLRNLIAAGHIAPGDVDPRSIKDVRPDDLRGYTQCHFFAGIGVWSYALRLAGWADDRPVWTGSCPCQPFSNAGKKRGHEDERHLWPTWHGLISERRPDVCFGEQVASPDGYAWLDLVLSDLEGDSYTVGACVTPAASVGAPHIRDRLYWVAHGDGQRFPRWAQPNGQAIESEQQTSRWVDAGGCCESGFMGHADDERLERWARADEHVDQWVARPGGMAGSFWSDAAWVRCTDGKTRPYDPKSFPLAVAHGHTNRVGRLRAYGNAIVAQQAQAWIEAFMEVRP